MLANLVYFFLFGIGIAGLVLLVCKIIVAISGTSDKSLKNKVATLNIGDSSTIMVSTLGKPTSTQRTTTNTIYKYTSKNYTVLITIEQDKIVSIKEN